MQKKAFNIRQITITAYTTNGDVIYSSHLIKSDQNHSFKLTLPADWPDLANLKIVSDEPGRKEYSITRDEFLRIMI